MEIIIVVVLIIFLIWLFSVNSSNKTSTYTKSSNSTTTYNSIDTYSTVDRDYYEIACKANEEGRHYEAIENYNKAISYKPCATYFNNRAFSKAKTNDYRGAIEDYSTAIQLDPNKALYWINRGILHINYNNDELACADWKKAAELGSEKAKIIYRQQRFKSDWEQYQNVLNSNNINTLFHFTDRTNLESIKRHGALYSWQYCVNNNIEILVPGGDDLSRSLDRNKNLQNYVRISFTRNHPMMFFAMSQNRIKNPVILEIDTEVIFWKNSKYANKNANRNDVNIGSEIEDFNKIKFDIVNQNNHFDLDFNNKPYFQAEVLILEKIPIEFIKNIDNI